MLGASIPVRWGRAPRFLIPFYLDDVPVQGRTFTWANGEKLQLMGGQFVAFGPHAVTGQPYEWENFDAPWPRLSAGQLQQVLAEVPARAGTSLRFSVDHETASADELEEAKPRSQDEWQAGRNAAVKYLGLLKQELLGKTEGRGSTIFSLAGVLKFAEQNGMCTREEIEEAITSAGQHLDEGLGGRTLGEEIARHDQLPVLRGNLIMQAIMSRRTLLQGVHDAMTAPTMQARTGFELSLEDSNAELPWILYQRLLAAEVHFVTGHSGAGKSTVVSDMALSCLTGRPWLDADVERTDGHILWVAAEDDYGTERRLRHLLRQEPNANALAARFHLIRGLPDPLAFEQQCIGQVMGMEAMGMRVDMIVLDTWGASGLCFADNDTESVLKAMFTIKQVAQKTRAAVVVTDHLPMGNDDAFQKGNGAKSGNSGFMYRVTAGGNDMVSIDCGKARGAPKARSYQGKIVSENYGTDSKGRTTTVNVFKREVVETKEQKEQSAVMKFAALLPGVTKGNMDVLRAGSVVAFEDVAAVIGDRVGKNEPPTHVATPATVEKIFGSDGAKALTASGHARTVHGFVFLYAPKAAAPGATVIPFNIVRPEKMPWQ